MNIIYSSNRIAARSWIKKKRIASFRGEVKGIEKDRLFSTISNPLPRFHPSVPVVDHGAMHHLVSEATVRRSPLPKTSSLLPHFPFLPLPFSSPSPNVLSFCNKRTRKKRPAGVWLTPSDKSLGRINQTSRTNRYEDSTNVVVPNVLLAPFLSFPFLPPLFHS